MPTLEQFLDERTQDFIEMLTVPCWRCQGKGTRTPCAIAAPDIICEECAGSGEIIPDRYGDVIAVGVLNMCISGMVSARAEEMFGRMSSILDWAYRYSLELTAHRCRDGQLAEALDKFSKVRARLQTKDLPPLTGALTEEELAALLNEDKT